MLLPLVGIAHLALAVGFYYLRGAYGGLLFNSDFVVFLLPTVLAFAGYLLAAWHCFAFSTHRRGVKIIASASIALAGLMISTYCAAYFAFNRWGT